MDSKWWDRPAYEPCPRRRSSLLGDAEYDYDTDPYPQQQVPHWLPLSEEDEEEDQVVEAPVLSVEQYQPPDLSEEEALRWAIEESELADLRNWEGLRAQLATSAVTDRGGASSSGAGASSNHADTSPTYL
jgi:hypothetical protein